MRDFRATLTDLLDTLNRNPLIEVESAHLGEPVPIEKFDKLIGKKKIKITKEIHELYRSISECNIEWTCNLEAKNVEKHMPEDLTACGRIQIRPIEKMLEFDTKLRAPWWTRALEPEEKKDLSRFRYFDFNDDSIRVGYILNERNEIEDQMYMLTQESTGFCPADLSFEAYLQKMIEYKGFQGWQSNHFYPHNGHRERMEYYLARLF